MGSIRFVVRPAFSWRQTGIVFYVLKSAIPIHFYVLKNVDDGIKNGYTKNMD